MMNSNRYLKHIRHFRFPALVGITVLASMLTGNMLHAQQQQPVSVQQPDCVVFFKLTAASSSGTMNNRQLGCQTWTVAYTSSGFTALSLTFQSAPDASGVAGTFVTFAGTTVTGTNPLTAITQAQSTFTGFYPWTRVTLSGLTGTGTVSGVFYGFRNLPSSTTTATITGNVTTIGVCTLSAVFNLTGTGNTQIIAAPSGTSINICHISLNGATSQNLKLTTGTGANCVTGTADLTGLYSSVFGFAFDFAAPLKAAPSQALCVNQSSAIVSGGVVVYALL